MILNHGIASLRSLRLRLQLGLSLGRPQIDLFAGSGIQTPADTGSSGNGDGGPASDTADGGLASNAEVNGGSSVNGDSAGNIHLANNESPPRHQLFDRDHSDDPGQLCPLEFPHCLWRRTVDLCL
jgi:hypothetical protein